MRQHLARRMAPQIAGSLNPPSTRAVVVRSTGSDIAPLSTRFMSDDRPGMTSTGLAIHRSEGDHDPDTASNLRTRHRPQGGKD